MIDIPWFDFLWHAMTRSFLVVVPSYIHVPSVIPAVPFVHKYENVFAFNFQVGSPTHFFFGFRRNSTHTYTFMQFFVHKANNDSTRRHRKEMRLRWLHAEVCHLSPTRTTPLPGNTPDYDPSCDVWEMIFDAALRINSAFNMYRIFDTYPVLWDVLGFP
jgi:carboxypeptidase D